MEKHITYVITSYQNYQSTISDSYKYELRVHRLHGLYLVTKNLKTPQADLFLATYLSHLKEVQICGYGTNEQYKK